MTEVEEKSWELSLYESLRTPQEAITENTGLNNKQGACFILNLHLTSLFENNISPWYMFFIGIYSLNWGKSIFSGGKNKIFG